MTSPDTPSRPLLDPKNDFVFKKLFAGAPDLLMALINAVRTGEPLMVSIEVLNPNITPADITGKYIVLDILAKDARADATTSKCRCADTPPTARAAPTIWRLR